MIGVLSADLNSAIKKKPFNYFLQSVSRPEVDNKIKHIINDHVAFYCDYPFMKVSLVFKLKLGNSISILASQKNLKS